MKQRITETKEPNYRTRDNQLKNEEAKFTFCVMGTSGANKDSNGI